MHNISKVWTVSVKGFEFQVSGTYWHDPGVWRYPDGSGQPPDWGFEYDWIKYTDEKGDTADVTGLLGELHWWVHSIIFTDKTRYPSVISLIEEEIMKQGLEEQNDDYYE